MGNGSSRGVRTAAIIAVVIAAALVCTAAGTLAAFSATYTWSSDTTTSGNFPYSDTDYTLALFEGAADIMPGDFGGATLEGPSFYGYDVAWTFSESNEATLPVVFYLRDGTGEIIEGTAYSKYDFSPLADTYTDAGGGNDRLYLYDVSADPAALTAALAVGVKVCWVWPREFYADVAGDTPVDSAAVDAYTEACRALCTHYVFDDALPSVLGGKVVAFATGKDGDAISWNAGQSADRDFSLIQGLPYVCGSECPVFVAGEFAFVSSSQHGLTADSEVWLFVLSAEREEIAAAVQAAELSDVVTVAGNYTFGDGTLSAVPDEDGNRTLLKIGVSQSADGGHPLSVTISATVSVG